MTGVRRNLEGRINSLLEYFPIVAILGVRQCGKTTIARHLRPNWEYFDLERGRDLDLITNDLEFFFKEHPSKVIFDEAQLSSSLLKELRGVIDRNREEKNRFIITGSSSPALIKDISESLAGRIGLVELGTLKSNEIYEKPLSKFYSIFESAITEQTISQLKAMNPSILEEELLQSFLLGGYPEPVLKRDPAFYSEWMENYFRTYIDRDIRNLFPKLDSVKYRRFIQILSAISATQINKSEIGRSIDSSEVTIRDYLDIAHNTYIWRNLFSFEKDSNKSVVKMPKGYMRDVGLLHFLQGIGELEALKIHPLVGANFEGFVVEEIIKGLQSTPITNWNSYYYRTRNGAEVDLVLKGPFGLVPIEIKYGTNINARRLRSLKDFIKERDCALGILVNRGEKIEVIADRIVQVPARYL